MTKKDKSQIEIIQERLAVYHTALQRAMLGDVYTHSAESSLRWLEFYQDLLILEIESRLKSSLHTGR